MPPPAAEPKPPPNPADVALLVNGVVWFFELGTQAMFMRNPELFELFPRELVGHHFPGVKEFVRGATERVAIKYSMRVPYGDEIVVVSALGFAAYGLAGGGRNDNKPKVTPPSDPRVRNAKNANTPPPAPEKREPRPVTADDDTEAAASSGTRAQRAVDADDVALDTDAQRKAAGGDGVTL